MDGANDTAIGDLDLSDKTANIRFMRVKGRDAVSIMLNHSVTINGANIPAIRRMLFDLNTGELLGVALRHTSSNPKGPFGKPLAYFKMQAKQYQCFYPVELMQAHGYLNP